MQVSYNNNRFTAGGNINTGNHYHGTNLKAIDILLENSAPGAFHNSGERFDPPKCHPRTRTYILNKIMDWVVGKVGWDRFIKWLYGPAGAGKSAIAQTIAEMCHAQHRLLATFFFSRTDPKRNNEKCLIATIAYQIALNAPVTRRAIEAAVDRDPAIFQRSIETQLTTLVINPLTQLFKTGTLQSTPVPSLIIIDGLDECSDHQVQRHILHTFSSAVQQPDVPLKFLICSRAETHLTLEFTSLASEGMATCLSLEDGYEQDADIERYLLDSFHKIATTHRLKAYIPSTWPTNDILSTLVHKSSGQFIFAATVVKYISSNRDLPMHRLEIVLGMQPSRNDRPFAELDALYMGILSSVEDVKVTLRLLGVLILCEFLHPTPKVVGEFMFLDAGEVELLLLDLASVVECVDMDTPIRILHASFPDFLFDRSRSQDCYIDASMMHAEIAQLCLSHIEVHEPEDCVECPGGSCETLNFCTRCIIQHLCDAEPCADLHDALLNTCYITALIRLETFDYYSGCELLAEFLFFLASSKFTDAEDLYLRHRNIYDEIMRKRMADFPLDLGSIVVLVLAGLHSAFDHKYYAHYFPAVEGGLLRIYQTLYFRSLDYFPCPHYQRLLTEFLTDPGRAGEHVLDGPKWALVARFSLDCFIPPCSEHNFFPLDICQGGSDHLIKTATLLSKASHSYELVTRINHADINCEFFTSTPISVESPNDADYLERTPCFLIKAIGDYLTRVVGSVPIDLKVTLRVYDKMSVFPSVTLGPLYYERQGQAMSESEEDGGDLENVDFTILTINPELHRRLH